MRCEICGGRIRSDNKYRVCTTTPECVREYDRRWYSARSNESRKHITARVRRYRRTLPGKASTLVSGARLRAREKGIPFDLTREWMTAELERAVNDGCPYLGIPIYLDAKANDPHCPSVDQFDPGAGYTQDNCIVVSYKANTMKQDCPPWLVEKFGENVARLARARSQERNAA